MSRFQRAARFAIVSSRDENPYGKRRSRSSRRSGSSQRERSAFEKATGTDASAFDSPPEAAKSLDQFRAPPKRLTIHPLEQLLLIVVAAHLVLLPWMLGTMRVPAQVISLVLSCASFVLALYPRDYAAEHTGGPEFRLIPLPKLLKFPIFWLGLALLALVTIQALNPAWEYQTNGKTWWMRRIAHIRWLPTGVRVPFEQQPGLPQGGPWRMLLIYSSAFLTVCSIWVGFTRRRTLQRLFIILAANGLLLAVFGLAQRVLRADKIFWTIPSINPSFFTSFIYKNHAGGYLLLVLAIACGLGAWYYTRGVRRLEKSSPAGLFAFFVTCIAVGILISYARGATFTMLAYLCVVVGGFIYHQWRLPAVARSPVIAIALLVVFGFFLKTGMQALHSELAWDRLRQAVSGDDVSVRARQVANVASLEMLHANWIKGVGSGAYPFLFPQYQQHQPEIAKNQFWPHAHNDILETPIEFGAIGTLLILAGSLYWTIASLRSYAWQNPLTASIILGCVSLIGMSWGEFVFYCPAILVTWCAMWPSSVLWAQLEEQRTR